MHRNANLSGVRRHGNHGRTGVSMTGFTLIEMIMTIVILGVIVALGANMIGGSMLAYFAGRDLTELDTRGRMAVERLTRELRAVRSATATDLNIATLGQVRFNDMRGNSVCFYLAGTQLMRSADFAAACGTTGPQVLVDGVSALNFTYLLNDGVNATNNPTLVYYIIVQYTVTVSGANHTYRATVHPRNIP